ncbi:FAD-binding molybdopterin dehydrogenase [Labrys miyagiensis]
MKLGTVSKAVRPVDRMALTVIARRARKSDAWLAGGTGLFLRSQPQIRRLVDLLGMNWDPLSAGPHGLTISATCNLGTLAAFKAPASWQAAPLIGRCCGAFPAGFTNWRSATVGGNLCMALPSGPMIALCAALEGICTVWTPAGGERRLSVPDFVRGPGLPALRAGEVLRSIRLPAEALERPVAFRRLALQTGGSSDALLIGTVSKEGDLTLTVTGSTRRPLQFDFEGLPSETLLKQRLVEDIPVEFYHAERCGRERCQLITLELAAGICRELQANLVPRVIMPAAFDASSFAFTGLPEGVVLH